MSLVGSRATRPLRTNQDPWRQPQADDDLNIHLQSCLIVKDIIQLVHEGGVSQGLDAVGVALLGRLSII
jgi:hypothetical protein